MPVVTISGPPGAGSSTVGRLVADALGVDFFSVGHHFKSKVGGDSETEAASEGWKDEKFSSESTHNSIDDLQKQIADQGDVVIDGKLSIHMVGGKADLTVWLEAPLKVRAGRAAERDEMDVDDVKEMMKERQHNEIEKWQEMYGFNYIEQKEDADLVVETEDRTPEEIAELIVSKLR